MAKRIGISPQTDREWEIKQAADTLIDAERVKKDKKLYKAAVAELKRRRDEVAKVVGQPGAAVGSAKK